MNSDGLRNGDILAKLLRDGPAVLYARSSGGSFGFTVVSDSAVRQLGHAPADLVNRGDTWVELVHPSDRAMLHNELSALGETQSKVLQYRFRHGDDAFQWIRDEAARHGDAIHGVITTLGESPPAEERLWHAGRVIAFTPDHIAVISSDYRFLFVNASLAKAHGHAPHELIGRHVAECFSDDAFQNTLRANYDRCLAGEEVHYRAWLPFQAAGRRYMSVNYLPVNQGGRVVALAVIAHDATAQMQVEADLRESRERYALAIEAINEGLWDWDIPNGRLYISQRLQALLGVAERPSITPAEWMEFVHPEDQRMFLDCVVAHFTGKTAHFSCEFRLADRGDGVRWMLDRGRALRDATGRANRMIGSMGDITERKAVEADVKSAKEQAELTNRAKSEFLATMSHELRTPLNAIIGFSDVMIHELYGAIGNQRYRGYLDAIHESGTHLLNLINDVLDVSAIEAGKLPLFDEDVDVATLTQASLRLVQARAEKSGVRLIGDVAADLPKLLGDERRLKQILLNLLSNAVKFTPNGGTVRLRVDHDQGMRFTVEDDGIGMDADGLRKAMLPFEQATEDGERRREGIGLGLPLTKGLVEAHGGTLALRSQPGRGTTVIVHLPQERSLRP